MVSASALTNSSFTPYLCTVSCSSRSLMHASPDCRTWCNVDMYNVNVLVLVRAQAGWIYIHYILEGVV